MTPLGDRLHRHDQGASVTHRQLVAEDDPAEPTGRGDKSAGNDLIDATRASPLLAGQKTSIFTPTVTNSTAKARRWNERGSAASTESRWLPSSGMLNPILRGHDTKPRKPLKRERRLTRAAFHYPELDALARPARGSGRLF